MASRHILGWASRCSGRSVTHIYYLPHISHIFRIHLAHISHISNFYYVFRNWMFTSLKFYGALLGMFRKPIRDICIISHASRTHLAHFKFFCVPYMECFYACLWSLLSTYILSHTFQTCESWRKHNNLLILKETQMRKDTLLQVWGNY